MAGPMKTIETVTEAYASGRAKLGAGTREGSPSSSAIARVIEAGADVGGELLEALALGFCAGLWWALAITAFAIAFGGIVAAVFTAIVWILARVQ
jgi:hypothetical protein